MPVWLCVYVCVWIQVCVWGGGGRVRREALLKIYLISLFSSVQEKIYPTNIPHSNARSFCSWVPCKGCTESIGYCVWNADQILVLGLNTAPSKRRIRFFGFKHSSCDIEMEVEKEE